MGKGEATIHLLWCKSQVLGYKSQKAVMSDSEKLTPTVATVWTHPDDTAHRSNSSTFSERFLGTGHQLPLLGALTGLTLHSPMGGSTFCRAGVSLRSFPFYSDRLNVWLNVKDSWSLIPALCSIFHVDLENFSINLWKSNREKGQ